MTQLKTKCEGSQCEETDGLAVYVVECPKFGHGWGSFTYCPRCAEVDRKRGFTLELAKGEPSAKAD